MSMISSRNTVAFAELGRFDMVAKSARTRDAIILASTALAAAKPARSSSTPKPNARTTGTVAPAPV
jgi:hypothetical protein